MVKYNKWNNTVYLPGSISERIGDLHTSKELSQKELSVLIGIAPSQFSRIESGETKAISSGIIINLAKALNVSTDYDECGRADRQARRKKRGCISENYSVVLKKSQNN